MIWENALLYLILALYASGFALALGRTRLGHFALITASISGITEFLSYVYSFLSNAFDMSAVFQSSSKSLSIPFKLVATWSGAPRAEKVGGGSKPAVNQTR